MLALIGRIEAPEPLFQRQGDQTFRGVFLPGRTVQQPRHGNPVDIDGACVVHGIAPG